MLKNIILTGFLIVIFSGLLQAQIDGTVYVFCGSPSGQQDTVTAVINSTIEIPIYVLTDTFTIIIADILLPLGISNCFFESFDTVNCQYHYPLTQWDVAFFHRYIDDYLYYPLDDGCYWDSYTFAGFAEIGPPYDSPMIQTDPDGPPHHALTFAANVVNDPDIHLQQACNVLMNGDTDPRFITPEETELVSIESYACYRFTHRAWLNGVITDQNQEPVSNALVWIDGSDRLDTASSSGEYELSYDSPDAFRIAVFHPGHRIFVSNYMRFNSGDTAAIDLELEPFEGYHYLAGDANMFVEDWPPEVSGADVTYLVNYFRETETSQPCYLDAFWASADVNGDCRVIGSDVTRLVTYFRGLGDILYCPEYVPAWTTDYDLPEITNLPGWPGCE